MFCQRTDITPFEVIECLQEMLQDLLKNDYITCDDIELEKVTLDQHVDFIGSSVSGEFLAYLRPELSYRFKTGKTYCVEMFNISVGDLVRTVEKLDVKDHYLIPGVVLK